MKHELFKPPDDEWRWIDKYKRDDIAVITSSFSLKWSRDLNTLLSKVFFTVPYSTDTYVPSRALQHEYNSRMFKELRDRGIEKILYVNGLDDFSIDYFKAGFVKKMFGIVHGSNHLRYNPHPVTKLKEHEIYVSQFVTLFSSTEWFSSQLPYKTIPVGLPIMETVREPRNSDQIIFNHRISVEKCPLKMLDFPSDLKEKLIISAPTIPQSNFVGKLKDSFHEQFVYCGTNDQLYRNNILRCGFGISLSNWDTFGYATIEGIHSGLCYFVPRNETTCYQDYMIDELLYDTIDELYEKLRYFMNHHEEKNDLVKKQQKILEKFLPENWLNNIMEYL
jgi:hypothetical protein